MAEQNITSANNPLLLVTTPEEPAASVVPTTGGHEANTGSENETAESDCLKERYWSYFLASSLIVFFLGLIAILSWRLAYHFFPCGYNRRKRRPSDGERTKVGMCTVMKWKAEGWISGQTPIGRFLVSLSCVLSIGSLIIYLIDASGHGNIEETCIPWIESTSQQIDLVFNLFFMFFFGVRFIAATDKLQFWLELHSIVDYFTIPPAFVGIYLSRQWLGLRFLRALRLISFPDILTYLSLLRTSNSIKLVQLSCIFVSVWLAGSGFIHLVETSGDPFYNFNNAQNLTYWECVYFALVTMSTVGYGDISCETVLGRLFMTFFIMGALAMFAGFIPEIMEILGRREKYHGDYDKPSGVKHVVVCGHITYDSVHNFLRDFLHEDRETRKIKCIFLESHNPDLELEALFKRHFTHVEFFKGSVMSTRDLERVKLSSAEACLIMANPRCRDPDAEDAGNIMRVISAKNFHQDIRVIVQLMRYHNKAFCMNLPAWSCDDQVICLSEMKLGFMAQGCLAPGFSTLLGNLFVMRSYKKTETNRNTQWLDQYLRGAGMEVYTERFSKEFYGKNFPEVAEFCFTKLNLLLVAVTYEDAESEDERMRILLNPGAEFRIEESTSGFFICESEEEVKRAIHYCHRCHGKQDIDGNFLTSPRACKCKVTVKNTSVEKSNGSITVSVEDTHSDVGMQEDISNRPKLKQESLVESTMDENQNTTDEEMMVPAFSSLAEVVPALLETKKGKDAGPIVTHHREQLDSTGLFHWCNTRSFDECILTFDRNKDVMKSLKDHFVLCVFCDEHSPNIGVSSFVMPLRASSLRYDELRTIVIVGNESFLRKEWESINIFPQIYVRPGSPLNRADMRAVKINTSSMCVILSANDLESGDATLIDKEAILCSLNIKTMTFRKVADIWKSSTSEKTMEYLRLLRAGKGSQTINIPHRQTTGACIPMLTELANDYNAQFLDQDDDDDPDIPLYMTQPFVCGRAFAASVLDSLMSTTYFNPEALDLIRMMISGGATYELEATLAEGVGMIPGNNTQENDNYESTRNRCRVALLPLECGKLEDYSCDIYGNLFVGALQTHGILCLGLYRQMDPRPSAGSFNRYVITNPSPEFDLYPSDKVYCLLPYEKATFVEKQPRRRKESSNSRNNNINLADLAGLLNSRNQAQTSMEHDPSSGDYISGTSNPSRHKSPQRRSKRMLEKDGTDDHHHNNRTHKPAVDDSTSSHLPSSSYGSAARKTDYVDTGGRGDRKPNHHHHHNHHHPHHNNKNNSNGNSRHSNSTTPKEHASTSSSASSAAAPPVYNDLPPKEQFNAMPKHHSPISVPKLSLQDEYPGLEDEQEREARANYDRQSNHMGLGADDYFVDVNSPVRKVVPPQKLSPAGFSRSKQKLLDEEGKFATTKL